MAEDIRQFLDEFAFPEGVNGPRRQAPTMPAPLSATDRLIDEAGAMRSLGERVKSPDGLIYELQGDGRWHPVADAVATPATPSPMGVGSFAAGIKRPFPELPGLAVQTGGVVPDPTAALYKAARDTIVGVGTLPGDVAGYVREQVAPGSSPTWAEQAGDWLTKSFPKADTGHTGTDVLADLLRYGAPGLGMANRAAVLTQGAPAVTRGLAQVGAAAATDAAVSRPDADRSIGDLFGAGPTQTEGLSDLGKRAALGGEAGVMSAAVEAILASLGVLKRGPSAPEAPSLNVTMQPPPVDPAPAPVRPALPAPGTPMVGQGTPAPLPAPPPPAPPRQLPAPPVRPELPPRPDRPRLAAPDPARPAPADAQAMIRRMRDSIFMQETAGGRNIRTSVDGAQGGMQIMPQTWRQYAKPGEDPNSLDDSLAVGERIIADLYRRSGGDPARVAVGYFSGPGNIAPPGFPTPWKRDLADGNGKRTSAYAADVVARLEGSPKQGVAQRRLPPPEGYREAPGVTAAQDATPARDPIPEPPRQPAAPVPGVTDPLPVAPASRNVDAPAAPPAETADDLESEAADISARRSDLERQIFTIDEEISRLSASERRLRAPAAIVKNQKARADKHAERQALHDRLEPLSRRGKEIREKMSALRIDRLSATIPEPDGSRFGREIYEGRLAALDYLDDVTAPNPEVLLQVFGKIAQSSGIAGAENIPHSVMEHFSMRARYDGALTSDDLARNFRSFADAKANALSKNVRLALSPERYWEKPDPAAARRYVEGGEAIAALADHMEPGAGNKMRQALADAEASIEKASPSVQPTAPVRAPEDMTTEEYVSTLGRGATSAQKRAALYEHREMLVNAARQRGRDIGASVDVGPTQVVPREGAFSPAPDGAGRIRGTPGANTGKGEFPQDRVLTAADQLPNAGPSLDKALDSADARRNQRVPSREVKAAGSQIDRDLKQQLDTLAAEAETAKAEGRIKKGPTPLVPVTVRHATGGETKYEVPYDAEKIREFSKRVTKGGMFYSNPFLNPALIRQVAPELINGAVAGVFGHYYDTGQIGFSPSYAIAAAFATTALMRVPIRGRTVLGEDSHASRFFTKAVPDAMAKTTVGRWFHPTGGVMPDLHDRFLAATREIRDMAGGVAEVSAYVRKNFTPAERALMSDWIEKVDWPGSESAGGFEAAASRVREQADALADAAKEVGEQLVDLGMLAKDDFERWQGQYLARYFAKHEAPGQAKTYGGDDAVQGRWAKARGTFKEISATADNRANLKTGDKLVRMVAPESGATRYVGRADVPKWEGKGYVDSGTWEVAARQKDGKTVLWRDWTPTERQAWGEIRDANYRYTKGMMAATHDLVMGKLFREIAGNEQWASATKREGWIKIPETKAQGTRVQRYGDLAGMYVHPDVERSLKTATPPWDRMTNATANKAMRAYKAAISAWKIGKTAYNPATWFNNITSNIAVSQMAGDVGPVDFVAGVKALANNAPVVEQARKAGLSIGPGHDAKIGDAFDAMQRDVALARTDQARWMRIIGTMLDGFTNNKLTRAYSSVDSAFKMASYLKHTGDGMAPADAVKKAHEYYFDYANTPIGAKFVRDFYVPFFSYFYHFAKMFPKLMAERPHGVAAAFGVLSGLSMYSYGKLYPSDPLAREEFEQTILPRWMKGRGAIGAPKSVRMPMNDTDPETGEQMPVFLSARYFMPGGDLLDFENNSGLFSDWWPAVLGGTPFGGNPFVNLLVGAAGNKDPFFGKAIMQYPDAGVLLGDADAPMWQRAQNVKDFARWASYQILPPTTTWTADKIGNALVGDGAIPADSEFARIMQWTGTDFAGRQRSVERVLAGTFGIKLDAVSPTDSVNMQMREETGKIKKAEGALISATRDGRVHPDKVEQKRRAVMDAAESARRKIGELNDLRDRAPQ